LGSKGFFATSVPIGFSRHLTKNVQKDGLCDSVLLTPGSETGAGRACRLIPAQQNLASFCPRTRTDSDFRREPEIQIITNLKI
jgi:hypothetical protein